MFKHQLEHHELHMMLDHANALGIAGIDIGQYWAWIMQYGFPLLAQVLAVILPWIRSNPSAAKYATVLQWVADALAALQNGKPLPPLPSVK